MLQFFFLTLMIILNFMFMKMKHPLSMGLTLLIQTMMVSLSLGMMNKTFWFSYILFLIFIGGMLVLFIYTTSLASNEMFSFSIKLMFMLMTTLLMILMWSLMMDKMVLMQFKNLEMNSITSLNSYMPENALTLNKLYNYPTNILTIMLMNYLFITLIAVVKITKLFKGPLRPMFN
uniref:NADH dehydrogenase subunit 6 n=1 Tax=Trixa longipennis TaxID=3025371 RepID=UPI0023AB3CFD|nr:NADH dehydrogenase subunit 6 [Trixa longipennis]WCL18820.1 NADH dehydrogenase subunit 6 [Trixa longipennis]